MAEKLPRTDDFDAVEFADSIDDLTPKNAILLGETALLNMEKLREQKERAQKLREWNAPTKIVDDSERLLNDRIDRYMKEDYDVEKELREPLINAPNFVKEAQNVIFSNLIKEGEKNFITETIRPEKIDTRGSRRYLLGVLGILPPIPATYYNFVDKLTEKNEEGEYVVSDETAKNFVSWYHKKAENKSNEILDEMESLLGGYGEELSSAIRYGLLPKQFEERLRLLENGSLEIGIGILDAINAYGRGGAGEFFAINGHCERSSFTREKTIRLGLSNNRVLETFYHEATHAIAGDSIDFDGNREAERIFNEGLTESISAILLGAIELEGFRGETEDELERIAGEIGKNVGAFGGETYKKERAVLEFLSSGGKKTIKPQEFYAAYAETDQNFELIRDEKYDDLPFYKYPTEEDDNLDEYDAFLSNPYRTYGPNQQKLINDLLSAFPECKDLAGLGEMIVTKFKELSE